MEVSKCFVRIVTASNGEQSEFTASGNFSRSEDGFSLTYEEKGDAVQLFYSGNSFTMSRRGEFGLSSEFVLGQETEFQIRLGDSYGTLTAFTDVFRVSEDGTEVDLGYSLRFGGGDVYFLLKLTISEES